MFSQPEGLVPKARVQLIQLNGVGTTELTDLNFTSVEFLPQPLPKLLRVLFVVPAVRHVLRCPPRILHVHQRRQALRHRRLKLLQGSHYKVSDKASFLERLLPMLAVRRLDLEFSV